MNLYLLTQEDAFYLPKLLHGFLEEKPAACPVVGASVLKGEIAVANVGAYLRLLGLRGFVQNGFHFARYKLLDWADRAGAGFEQPYSVAGALRKHDVPHHATSDINDPAFQRRLRELEVDLVISVACPQIVRAELLNLPPEGVINIHGALLPKYRGKLPSFWVLANGEEKTGVTVHYMNEALDDGPIIVQKEVPIAPDDTLHSLVLKSKVDYGISALAEAVAQIAGGRVETQPNREDNATYFSFPDQEAVAAFRRRGRTVR